MTHVHRIAGLKVSRRIRSKQLPDLAPPEERLDRARSQIFSADLLEMTRKSVIQEATEPVMRGESQDLVARLTVYAMNLSVIVFAAPLGMALLLFNILGGENLRTTAHSLALMGLFLALNQAGAFA